MTPIDDQVVILQDAAGDSISGFALPDAAQTKPKRGKVIVAGQDATQVKEGDVVLYSRFSGTEIEVDGVKYLVMKQAQILIIE
jgi:chaperonin GroES